MNLPLFKNITKGFLPKVNERGIAHLFIIIFILLALALGVYLVQTRTNINPFASISSPISGPLSSPSPVPQPFGKALKIYSNSRDTNPASFVITRSVLNDYMLNNPFTVDYMFKVQDTKDKDFVLLQEGNRLKIYLLNSVLTVESSDGSIHKKYSWLVGEPNPNKWYHFGFTHKDGNQFVYYDGQIMATQNVPFVDDKKDVLLIGSTIGGAAVILEEVRVSSIDRYPLFAASYYTQPIRPNELDAHTQMLFHMDGNVQKAHEGGGYRGDATGFNEFVDSIYVDVGPTPSVTPSLTPTPTPSPSVTPVVATAELGLTGPSSIKGGETVEVKVKVKSQTETINLVSAQMNYAANLFEISEIMVNSTFEQEIEKVISPNGEISLIYGVRSNSSGEAGGLLTGGFIDYATIRFKAKGAGSGSFSINNASEVLRKSDSQNILIEGTNPNIAELSITATDIVPTPPPTAAPIACSPRPNIGRTTEMTAQGLKVTLNQGTNSNTPANPMSEIRFTRFDNGTVTIGGQFYKAPFTYQLLNQRPPQRTVFYINQVELNKPTTVHMIVKDRCGDYALFFGGGTSAGWPTVIPAPPTNLTIDSGAIVQSSAAPVVPVTTACKIDAGRWDGALYPTNSTAVLRVEASGNCEGKKIVFNTWEDDGLLGTDPVATKPLEVYLVAISSQPGKYVATSTWNTEFQEDGVFGTSYPPEYSFNATIEGESTSVQSTNQITVSREIGKPSPVVGDLNRDNKANLGDMSWLLAHWDQKTGNEVIDVFEDEAQTINTADYSKLLGILQQNGTLKKR